MATNSIGSGKTNLSVSITAEMREDLGRLAEQSGMKIGEYCRAVLQSALANRVIYEKRVVMLAEDPRPYRTEADAVRETAAEAKKLLKSPRKKRS